MDRKIKTFVRRKGRMSNLHTTGFETYGPNYLVPYKEERLSYKELYGNSNPLVLEIGFGMGDATIQIAENRPEINFLGVEVHTPGVGKVLYEAGEVGLTNLKLIHHDAVEVLHHMLPPESLQGVHLFFPDPWPKKKHHKRRIYSQSFLNQLHTLLIPGGYIYSATDWEPYGAWMLETAEANPLYINPHRGFAKNIAWRPTTRFEQKGVQAGREIYEVWIEKSS